MLETDNKGVNQLLLSPLFLLDRVLGTLAPGVLLVFLLALKGNRLLGNIWLNPALGYKTKVAGLLFLSYITGTFLKVPHYFISKFAKTPVLEMPPQFHKQTPEVTKAFYTIFTDGVLWASPRLLDRLSLSKAEVAFHIGAGTALMVASVVPGDGLRVYECLSGLLLFGVGIWKAHDYAEELYRALAIGAASILGNLNTQQVIMLKSFFETFKKPNVDLQTVPTEGSSEAVATAPPRTAA